MYTAIVITVSDKGYAGQRQDEAGPAVCRLLEESGFEIREQHMVPDDQKVIEELLRRCADQVKVDLILTTGGTGFSVRDVTPEATLAVCERLVPGIPEVMRFESYQLTKRAMLSRAVAGIRGQSLIINLPGSPKAAVENLSFTLPTLGHGLDILKGDAAECAVQEKT